MREKMKKLMISFLAVLLAVSAYALEPMGGFRSTFGDIRDLNRHVLEVVKSDLEDQRTGSLDEFIDQLELLDDPTAFAPAIKAVKEILRYRMIYHREDSMGLATRLKRINSIEMRNQAIEAPKPILFPRDGGNHVNKLLEWWYFNGHLYDENEQEYGFEFCFFRASPFVFFVHVALTDVNGKQFYFKRRMVSPRKVELSSERMELNYDGWEVSFLGDQHFLLKAKTEDFTLNLRVQSRRKPLLFNQSGFVKMSKDGHSYYYSLTSMETSGAIRLKDRTLKVKGETWFDHQWGNFVISCVWGWDWFCVKLQDGTRYNVFGFHDEKGKLYNPVVSCLMPDNTQKTTYELKLYPIDFWTSPHTFRKYPSGYRIELPEWKTSLRVVPKVKDQELPANAYSLDFIDYWEGTCSVEGTREGSPVQGRAYNEICGYPRVKPSSEK